MAKRPEWLDDPVAVGCGGPTGKLLLSLMQTRTEMVIKPVDQETISVEFEKRLDDNHVLEETFLLDIREVLKRDGQGDARCFTDLHDTFCKRILKYLTVDAVAVGAAKVKPVPASRRDTKECKDASSK